MESAKVWVIAKFENFDLHVINYYLIFFKHAKMGL